MRKFLSHFITGGLVYPLMEIGFRGYTHWTMGIAGGLVLNILVGLGRRFHHKPLAIQGLLGAGAITLLEFTAGCILNKWLKLAVWDYSHLPWHVFGQICLPFCALWYALSLPVLCAVSRFQQQRHPWFHLAALVTKPLKHGKSSQFGI